MITKAFSHLSANLTSVQVKRGIVLAVPKKKSRWDKTNYIEDYVSFFLRNSYFKVPPVRKYHRTRKPRLPEWEDPNIVWPPVLPKSYHGNPRHLIGQLKQEETEVLKAKKTFEYPDFRSGDVIKFHYLHSMSEGNGNTITGVCIGVNDRHSLDGSFLVVFNLAGIPVRMRVKMYSPLLTQFELL